MAVGNIIIKSPVFTEIGEIGENRIIIPGNAPVESLTEYKIGESLDVVIHWMRQPTSGSIELKFQSTAQRFLNPTVFDSVQDGIVSFSSTPVNKKIIRDVHSGFLQVRVVTALGGAVEFLVEPITYVSRS